VDRALGQAGDDASLTQGDACNRFVVRQHGDDRVTSAGIGDAGGGFGALADQWFHLGQRAVIDSDLMSGLQEVGGHPASHVSQSDEIRRS
jgi:hypothetical protein